MERSHKVDRKDRKNAHPGTSIPWERACRMLEAMFRQIGVSSFPDVTIGDGHAHRAFSSDSHAVIVQPYLGKEQLSKQCEQLRSLRERLLENEPDSQVMAAIYVPNDQERIPRYKGITRISPGNLTTMRHFFNIRQKGTP